LFFFGFFPNPQRIYTDSNSALVGIYHDNFVDFVCLYLEIRLFVRIFVFYLLSGSPGEKVVSLYRRKPMFSCAAEPSSPETRFNPHGKA
jgi:hypothetical protein